MYLRAAKTEAEDAGISTEGMADSVSQLRGELLALTGGHVDIMSDAEAGSYKSTVEILRQLSEVWDDLSDTSKTNITELIGGGVRNANTIASLMQNFDIVDRAIKVSTKSAGSALEENEKHLDSIVGKTQKFQAAFETMSTTFVDNDVVKSAVDIGTGFIEALTFIGDKAGGALALFTTGRALDTITGFGKGIEGFKEGMKGLVKDTRFEKFFTMLTDSGQETAGGGKATPLLNMPAIS